MDKSNCNCYSCKFDFLLVVIFLQCLNIFVYVYVEFFKIVNNDKYIDVLFF